MLFNGLESAVCTSKMWGTEFSDQLKALLSFLNKGLRDRFVATCMVAASVSVGRDALRKVVLMVSVVQHKYNKKVGLRMGLWGHSFNLPCSLELFP